jgi:hypothetical protein
LQLTGPEAGLSLALQNVSGSVTFEEGERAWRTAES